MTSETQWEDTYTFMQLDTDGNMAAKQIGGEWVTLGDLATAFADFLRGSGYPHVEEVEIRTDRGTTFGSD